MEEQRQKDIEVIEYINKSYFGGQCQALNRAIKLLQNEDVYNAVLLDEELSNYLDKIIRDSKNV